VIKTSQFRYGRYDGLGIFSEKTSSLEQRPYQVSGRTALCSAMYLHQFIVSFCLVSFDVVGGRALDATGVPVGRLEAQKVPRRLLAVRADASFQSNKMVLDTTWVNATLLKQEMYVLISNPHFDSKTSLNKIPETCSRTRKQPSTRPSR
jgi:hypothetical protein